MESTKEVLVRRSNNLLYFPSNLNSDLYKTLPFRNNGITFTKTLDDVHFEGQWDGTENTSGGWGVAYCNITLAAGTYTLSNDENYQGQTIINKKVDNAWVTIAQCPYGNHTKTFTLTETTVISRMFWSNANMDKNVPIDMWMHPMLVEGDTKQDYEPYYYEYETSKEVFVRRSNNLFLPFSSTPAFAIGDDHKFEYDPTLFYTIEENGNLHVHGTKSVLDSGYIVCDNFTAPLTLKAGKTYSYKYNYTYGNCSLQSTISGTRVSVLGSGRTKFTPTVDTPITHLYVDVHSTSKEENVGKEYDFYLSPMVVEGDTAQDYEPYYYEAEASKTGIYPTDISLTSIVDFSGSLYNKILLDSGNMANNDVWATTKDLTPCVAGTTYWYKANMLKNTEFRQASALFYDSNKNVIGKKVDFGASWGVDKSVVAPEGAVYMRITYSRMGTTTDDPYPINPIIYVAETTQEEA